MSLPTLLGLLFVSGGSTMLGSAPLFFHQRIKESHWNWWECFGGGVMVSASVFSLFLPAIDLIQKKHGSYSPLVLGIISGVLFIFLFAWLLKRVTENIHHQRALLFVFVMALHNVPEGLAVGVDVAGVGWHGSLPLVVAIFIQNLPEGAAASMSFFVSGFSVKKSLLANGLTAVIEALSSLMGYSFVTDSLIGLPFLLTFSGACMLSVVTKEAWNKSRGKETATFSYGGFIFGVSVCAVLDFVL